MNPAQFILGSFIQLYRWTLSPAKTALFGPIGRCRFTPSCSAYALQAIREHGATRGSWLAARRLCRCHPWGGCGHDPVPARAPEVSGGGAGPRGWSWKRYRAGERAGIGSVSAGPFV